MSSFEIEEFECGELSNYSRQLAILLYPPELFNEKFLINIRSCMLNLPEEHPVKRWLKFNSVPARLSSKQEYKQALLSDLLNSPFNLITDFKVKSSVADLLTDIPEDTILDKLLKSYLFLMIGNVTKSDNIFRSIVLTPPRLIYKGYKYKKNFFNKVTEDNLEKIFLKFSRHPADRRIFELFLIYVTSFMNDSEVISISNKAKMGALDGTLGLEFTERISPELVKYIRYIEMTNENKVKNLLDTEKFSLDLQSNWIWPFIEEAPIYSEKMGKEIKRMDEIDPLWVIYLLDDERAADIYSKQGGLFNIQRKREFLREHLSGKDFMMALYKLIQLGDIDGVLVEKVSDFLTHE